jgi:Xaa-Pro aminopeptidase
MTRTFLIGDVDAQLLRIHDIVREAQLRAMATVAPGVRVSEVDRACREFFREQGVEDLFIHGTGHGVGLAIHEEPFVGRNLSTTLEVGDVVTVEPGLYRMGLGGVRIEDLLVVTEDAHRCLTMLPKDSPCLPSQRTI